MTKPLQQDDACCPVPLGPIKLLETGGSIVDPQAADIKERFNNASCAVGKPPAKSCFSPPSFYRQYTNAYSNGSDYRNGIPIMSTSAQNESLLQVRGHVSLLLKWSSRIIPNVAEYLNKAYIRVLINPCKYYADSKNNWAPHPEGDPFRELGGAERRAPSVGSEESGLNVAGGCLASVRLPVSIEEFFHTIQHVAMMEQDPDAFVAIMCVAARDTSVGLFGTSENLAGVDEGGDAGNGNSSSIAFDQLPTGLPGELLKNLLDNFPVPDLVATSAPTAADRFRAVLAEYENDWLTTVSLEYYINAVAVWMGLPFGDFLFVDGTQRTTSRALLKKNLPDVACLVARYFPDVGEEDGEFCAEMQRSASSVLCKSYPGSCFCSDTMTAQYLGPALNRSRCPTLQQIKEQSGFKDKPLPGNAAHVPCRGCIAEGCDTDKGLRRKESPNPSGFAPIFSASAAATPAMASSPVIGCIFVSVAAVFTMFF